MDPAESCRLSAGDRLNAQHGVEGRNENEKRVNNVVNGSGMFRTGEEEGEEV